MKIMRNYLQEFYGIDTEGTGGTVTTTYHYINPGFLKLDESGGAQVETEAYIGDKNATPTVTGYENAWEYECHLISGNEVCDDLYDIAINQKIGSECERKLVSINLDKPSGSTTGTYEARMFTVAIEAAPPQGEPRSAVKMTGTMHQMGDMVKGTFNVSTKAFTPAE